MMELDKQSIGWIQKALEMAPFGSIKLVTQNGLIMKIITESQIYVSMITAEGVDSSVKIEDILSNEGQGHCFGENQGT